MFGAGAVLLVPAFIVLFVLLPQAVRITREYERGVIFRLG
jgi:regulator of protease activity HflC (stomatin/prohibitin superfamily)